MEILMFILGLICGFLAVAYLLAWEFDGMTEEEMLEFVRDIAEEEV